MLTMEPYGACCKVIIVFLCFPAIRTDITCRNEAGEPVDWFVVYKLPKEFGSGLGYMYLDSAVETWQMSQFTVNTSEGAIGLTLNQLYLGQAYMSNSTVYAMYNDGPPDMDYLKGYGHTKGVLLFDHAQGFWLSHSVPHFPYFPERGYQYPSSGKLNGQTALCMTYKYRQFPIIARQLVYLIPRVYNCSVPSSFLDDFADLAQLCEGSKFPLPSSSKNIESLLSAKGEEFVHFAKSERFVDDIYTGWVAQELGTDLLVETWQRQNRELPSNCSLENHAMNVQKVCLPGPTLFESRHDHSKWCVSTGLEDQWACVGDLNRERAQVNRAGGLLCTRNPFVYKAFRQVVSSYKDC
ncbi:deoxyribonuclease-2-beta [Gadus morhua]|nr:deoxyribonuclease-2-beta [Gadus morhua]